jgi:hypothetical protein
LIIFFDSHENSDKARLVDFRYWLDYTFYDLN